MKKKSLTILFAAVMVMLSACGNIGSQGTTDEIITDVEITTGDEDAENSADGKKINSIRS